MSLSMIKYLQGVISMRFLHTADWHIGKIVNEFPMIDYQRDMLKQIIHLLKEEPYDCLVIAGDLYDRAQPKQEYIELVNQVFKEIIEESNTPILLISGNHDSGALIGYGDFLLHKQGLYSVGLFSEQIRKVSMKDSDFYLFPFVTPSQGARDLDNPTIKTYDDLYREVLSSIKLDPSKNNILLAHGYIVKDGNVLEKEDSVRPLSVGTAEYVSANHFEAFDYVALGHLHSHHHIGNEKIQYSGSLMKYSKSEVNNKISVTEVEIMDHQLKTKRLFLTPSKDLLIKEGYYNDLIKESDQNFIFFELLDTHIISDAMTKLRINYPYAMGLSYKNIELTLSHDRISQQEISNKSTLELFKDFYQQSQSQILNQKQNEFLKEVLKEETL